MKKFIALLMAALLAMTLFAGCANGDANTDAGNDTETQEPEAPKGNDLSGETVEALIEKIYEQKMPEFALMTMPVDLADAEATAWLTGMAACLMLALVLVFPAPRAEFAGVQPAPRMATMSLKETAAPLAELALEWDGKSELTVSGGTLEYGEDSVVWQVFEEGEYTLTARRGLRTRTVTYTVNVTEDGLSVLKAR